jgi:folate-binding protein YgfZ
MTPSPAALARLDELALIEFSGADALTFLHGQLTQDLTALPEGQARLAGYCTAQGRLLATMVIWPSTRQPGALRALVRADLADALVKRLRMFVLRAKVTIERGAGTVWGVGLSGADARAAAPAWTLSTDAAGDWVRAPDGAQAGEPAARCWLAAEPGHAPAGADDAAWAAQWRARDIRAGLPWVQDATRELFIPQTLNLDLTGAVSFTKGCYPGQEVVARSHYRGTLKRRMAAGSCAVSADSADAALCAAGTDIFDAREPDAPWGRVVNAQIADGQAWLLFEAQLASLDQADLRLGSAAGPVIHKAALPYDYD